MQKQRFVDTLNMQALRARLIQRLRNHPPVFGFLPAYDLEVWLNKHMTQGEMALLKCVETAVGEEEGQ